MDKKYNVKIYDKAGTTLLKTVTYEQVQEKNADKEEVLLSAPSFAMKKNGGLGQCKLKFNFKFDDFGDFDGKIVDSNEIRIWEVSSDNPSGILIYSGFINDISPVLKESEEYLEVELLGYVSRLGRGEFQTAGGSPNVEYTAEDPAQMLRDIIDQAAVYYPQLNYTAESLPDVGFVTDYTFEELTWVEAIKIIQSICGVDFYWYVDKNNTVYLLEKAASAEKKYLIGASVQEGKIVHSPGEIVNKITLEAASGNITVEDVPSQNAHGYSFTRVSATSITSSDAAQIQADYLLASQKDLKVSADFSINSTKPFYDIRPGMTVKIQGLKASQDVLGDNLIVETVTYTPDKLKLSLEERRLLADEVRTVAETPQKF